MERLQGRGDCQISEQFETQPVAGTAQSLQAELPGEGKLRMMSSNSMQMWCNRLSSRSNSQQTHTNCTQDGSVRKSRQSFARAAPAMSDSTRRQASAVERGGAPVRHDVSNAVHQLTTHETTDGHETFALGALRVIKKMEEMHSIAVMEGAAGDDLLQLNAAHMAGHECSKRRVALWGSD